MPSLPKPEPQNPKLFVVMGVSGCGKSTVARALAEAVGGVFLEGDDLHPPTNKAKMAAGIPLTDDDRWPWYDRIIQEVRAVASPGTPIFLSCSALKKTYRDRLRAAFPHVRFLYLKGDFQTIKARMEARTGHFMPPSLLESQFAALEEPHGAVTLDITMPVVQIIDRALTLLGFKPAAAS
jgi:gluconokinase